MQGTTQLKVCAPSTLIDALSDTLILCGALAVSLSDAKDEPLFQLAPEDEPLWQETAVTAIFPETTLLDPLIEQIKQADPRFADLHFFTEVVEDKNWVEETQKQFPPQQYGDLWVYPDWEIAPSHKSDQPTIRIAPGLAFGTGTHPTTKLCLEWLSNNPPKNQSVIDYGCGSGILALAAIALDARDVYATDHDPQALESISSNADRNTFKNAKLHIKQTSEMPAIKADLVLANILANPLIDLAPTLTAFMHENSKLVLSGLLNSDVLRITETYLALDCKLIEQKTCEEWELLVFTKNIPVI